LLYASDLQQTPATAAKASIRITAKDNQIITFTFNSTSARDDQQAVTGKLRKWIELSSAPAAAGKSATPLAAAENGSSQSASMTMAQTAAGVAATPRAEEETYDDAKLMKDVELQRSLLNASPALRQRFDQALRDKPDSISIAQFATQFWATRVHLLRSHAAEKAQGPGTYNVLSVIKPQQVDGKTRLNITKEQIQLIFAQHPLVKRVYNDLVPQIKEDDFWSRFFTNRLIKKLKGEKITELDPVDPKFDKYLDFDDDDGQARQLNMDIVPRFIDVAGNEQNHSQRQGNRPDWTMQPNHYDKVPILRTLNRMSEKMMVDVPPSDLDRHAPAGVDEQTYKELQLRDLQRDDVDNRVVLKIKDQAQLFAAGQDLHSSSSASTYTKRTPAQVLSLVQNDFVNVIEGKGKSGGFNLGSALGVEEDSSSEEEGVARKRTKVGSRSTRTAATTQIIKAIKKRHLHNDDILSFQKTASSEQAARLGFSQTVFDTLAMTHNTTVEFLHYFWTVYLSGDPDRASEVARLIETLDKSLDRIKAVADNAESERAAKIGQLTREYEAYTKRTGKKRKFDPNNIEGGAKAVNKVVSPLVRAIRSAKDQFEKALHEQLALAAASINKLPDAN
jgi:transcription initiation factor TFIIH subunit 1